MSLVSSPFFFSSASTGFYPYEPTGSLRFEDGDSPYLQRTPTTAGNRRTFTFSAWVKRGNLTNYHSFFSAYSSSTSLDYIFFNNNDTLAFRNYNGTTYDLITNAVFRDPTAWLHIVVSVDTTQSTASDRVKIYVNGEVQSLSTATYPPQNHDFLVNSTVAHYVGYNGYNYYDGYVSEVYLVDGTAHDADAFGELKNGVWVPKDAKGSLTFGTNGFYLPFNSTVTAEGQSTVLYEGVGGTQTIQGMGYKPDLLWVKRRTGGTAEHALHDRLRGPAGIIGSDNTNAEIQRGYVTAFHDDGFALTDNVSNYNTSGSEYVAWAWDAGADQPPTGFGCVTFTGSGSRRPVRDVGFTPDLLWFKQRNGTSDHALFDSVRGADKGLVSSSTAAQTTSNSGNDLVSFDSDGATTGTPQNYGSLGGSGNDIVAWAWDAGDGDPASNTDGDITSTVKASDTHGFSIGTFTKGSGTQTVGHGLSAAPDWLIVKRYTGGTGSWAVYHSANTANPETDYLRLNSTNGTADDATFWGDTAPTSSVFSVGSAFNSGEELLFYAWTEKAGYSKFGSYTGNGSATGPTVTLGFRPALVAIKRSDSTGNWYFFDTTRDPDNKGQRYLRPNTSEAEGGSGTGTEYIDFQSNGFQIIASGADFGEGNTSGGTYLYMAFAGGLDTIAPVNTDGTADSRVKASTEKGFSIVRYEGSDSGGGGAITVGHGLSAAPELIITKNLDAVSDWRVYSDVTGNANALLLNSTAASGATSSWNSTSPTSTVFSSNIYDGNDIIAYCFHSASGYSKIGSYTGNGSASGPSVTGLGFKPSLIIIKRTDATNNWIIQDTFRDTDGIVDNRLYPNLSNAEDTGGSYGWTADSDGFTIKTSEAGWNASGGTYLYMAFKDGKDSSFFHDESGQDNNFEPENLQNYDVVPDSPTNNFGIVSPLAGAGMTLSEGNLKVATTTNYRGRYGSFGVSSGKWYYEVVATDYTSGGGVMLGWGHRPEEGDDENPYDHGFGVSTYDGSVYVEGTQSTATGYTSKGANYTLDGDIYGIVLDVDNETLYVHKNGTYFNSADPAAGTGGLSVSSSFTAAAGRFMLPIIARGGSYNETYTFNFGQDDSFAGTVTPSGYTDENERGAFKYPVPSGFLSMCTANLPDPAINPASNDVPEDYFNTVLYTGNNTADTSITTGNSPDFVWIKRRDASNNHGLFDSVRGATKRLSSNRNNAEDTLSGVTSFDSNGFTLGTDLNDTGFSGVAWNWEAGTSYTPTVTGGFSSPSASINTKAGFGVYKFTGSNSTSSFTHGLGTTPALIISKNLDNAFDWGVWHKDLSDTSNKILRLNTNDAEITRTGIYPTVDATEIEIDSYGETASNGDYVYYVFTEVEGYSKVGSYTGNGSTDGPFVYCGFRPAFILTKRTDGSGSSWEITDATRSPENVVNENLYADLSDSEYSFGNFDYLSNGFKLRSNLSASAHNISGANYIFYAVAEQPFKFSNAR